MEDLKRKLTQLKRVIASKEEEDKKLRTELKEIIEKLFDQVKTPMEFIRGFYLQGDRLVINTNNKSFANELFLVKNQLLEGLWDRKFVVKELVIK
ncbi:MAG: hypothetical protein WED06_02030 [Candidatus Paceibacterota bacterium]